jgi:phosphoglycerol transferase MdoB-like AlkP superfamily enzyme
MTKSTIVKLFWGSLIGLVAGLVLMGITFALAISNDIFIMSGPDVSGIRSGVLSWTLLGLMGLAMLLLLFAAVAHFVAWIGAVLNTAQLPDKTWFVVLLVVGLLGLVFIATVAYVIAGPDGVKAKEEASAMLPQPGAVQQQVPPSTMTGPGQHATKI